MLSAYDKMHSKFRFSGPWNNLSMNIAMKQIFIYIKVLGRDGESVKDEEYIPNELNPYEKDYFTHFLLSK